MWKCFVMATGSPQEGWLPDPGGVFEYRYWDGSCWTAHISHQGEQGTAPLNMGGDPEGSLQRGFTLAAAGDLDGAEIEYCRADADGNAVGALQRGLLLRERGELALAEAAFRRSSHRGEPAASCNLGVLLEDRGDLAGAEAAYRRADERDFAGGAYALACRLPVLWDHRVARSMGPLGAR
jgi:tetratricopeptide (TPR) repeat protein